MTDERWPIIVKDRWPEPNDYVKPPEEGDTLLERAAILGLHLRNLVVAIEDDYVEPNAHVAALLAEAKVILGWSAFGVSSSGGN